MMFWTLLVKSIGSMMGDSVRDEWNVREPEIGWNGEREWWSSEGSFVPWFVIEGPCGD
jgi:hypothetical protein